MADRSARNLAIPERRLRCGDERYSFVRGTVNPSCPWTHNRADVGREGTGPMTRAWRTGKFRAEFRAEWKRRVLGEETLAETKREKREGKVGEWTVRKPDRCRGVTNIDR